MTCSIAPAITGMSASTGCRRSFVTAIASMDPRTTAIGMIPGTSCSIPYSRALSCGRPWGTGGNLPRRSLMTESMIDRIGVINPRTPLEDTIIYELHVRGYTIDPSSGVHHPGTLCRPFREDRLPEVAGDHGGRAAAGGRVRRERLPVRQSADWRAAEELTGATIRSPSAHRKRPMRSNPERSEPWDEFCDMVDAFHRRGIEVYSRCRLQPHGRGRSEDGPTYNFRGLDNSLYYMLDEHGRYLNFSGLRQHVQQRSPGRPRLSDRLPAELGRRGRDRWLSL